MKQITITIVLALVSVFSITAQEKEYVKLTVNVSGMESSKGAIFAAVYNSKESFLKKEYRGAIVKIKDKKATITFKDLELGMYAVSVFHDENGNKKMDTNFFGIPKEFYGASNNAKGFMSPPKYKDAKFTITKNTTIFINVH